MEDNSENQRLPHIKKRHPKPWIAFILSLICDGLGQLYNGELKKGIIFFLIPLVAFLLFGWLRTAVVFYGLLALILPLLLFRMYVIIDAIKTARKTEVRYFYKGSMIWAGIWGFVMIGIAWNISPTSILGIRTFSIATGAGEPNVFAGDKLIADLKAYNTRTPEYGDIVAFEAEDGSVFTFRIVGLPNDTLQLRKNVVYFNSYKTQSKLVSDIPF